MIIIMSLDDKNPFIFIVFTSIMLGQKIKRATLNSSFVSSTLIIGVPFTLKNNNYFSQPEKIYYAAIYHNLKDSIYFISKRLTADSNSYVIVLTSDNKIMGYSYLDFKKINQNNLYTESKIEKSNRETFTVKLFYSPKDNTIRSNVVKNSILQDQLFNSMSNLSAKNNVRFELGIGDEETYLYANADAKNMLKIGIPVNIHLYLGLNFLKHYKLDFRYGILYAYEDFFGFDAVIFFKSNLFHSNFYGKIGADFFSNIGSGAHGVVVYTDDSGEVTFLCLGLGYNMSKQFNLDITYYLPFINRVYGYEIVNNYLNGYLVSQKYDNVAKSLFSLGFQYSFIL